MEKYKNKNILVIGLGVSGFSAAELLAKNGFHVKVTDSGVSVEIEERARYLRKEYSIEVENGGHSPAFCNGTDLIIVSPGVDLNRLYEKKILSKKIPVISELELGYRFCTAPIIAITGTNGKTTTTELTGSILKREGLHTVICGNIGNPLTGEIDNIHKDSIVIVEASSFQLEHIESFCPFIGVILNVSEDHYDRHKGYDEYIKAKFNLLKNQTETNWAILHSQLAGKFDPAGIKSKVVLFGDTGAYARVTRDQIFLKTDDGEELFVSSENLLLEGIHNMNNAAASILVSKILGVSSKSIIEGVALFSPDPHRFQKLGIFDGIEYIDDSKATNIDATRAALDSLDRKVILIAGGKDKGGDYCSIESLIREKVKKMILIGEARCKMRRAYADCTDIIEVSTMDQAVDQAVCCAREGDIIMLSPMCSSFDMFLSYKQRGELFQSAVNKLTSL